MGLLGVNGWLASGSQACHGYGRAGEWTQAQPCQAPGSRHLLGLSPSPLSSEHITTPAERGCFGLMLTPGPVNSGVA